MRSAERFAERMSPSSRWASAPSRFTSTMVKPWMTGAVPSTQQDVPGYIQAPAIALGYPWKHFIGGHLGRLGNRDDILLHQQYIADIQESARQALATVDPTPYFVKYGPNVWAAVKTYVNELTNRAAAPVIAKYTGVLAAADSWPVETRRPPGRSRLLWTVTPKW